MAQKQNDSIEHGAPQAQQLCPSNEHAAMRGSNKLCLTPNTDHKPENYEDVQLEFNPLLFSSLEQYLPAHMLDVSHDIKVHYMRDILLQYVPENEDSRIEQIQKHKEYRRRIILNYVPLHRDIYEMDAEKFFTPSFLKAIKENTEASFRSIMLEPCGGIFTFQMFQPQFCEMLMAEVNNFQRWVQETKFRIMRPNTMNQYGAVLGDFGLEPMLNKLMRDFVCPLSRVFYSEIGGSTLDSHHGFVVEYGIHRDLDLGFHVDDAEVSINICLGNKFSGGELFFRGVRCDEHVNSSIQPEEIFDYAHVPGQAILHAGRHRHGVKPTTSGNRMNLILWCRSSTFRELKKYHQNGFFSWCGECKRERKEKERLLVMATQQELMKNDVEWTS